MPTLYIDFETRSECDLKKHRSYIYSKHSSTEVLCMAYKIDGGPTRIWINPKFQRRIPANISHSLPEPSGVLIDWLIQGNLITAHNSSFECDIWDNIMVPKFHWPQIPLRQWRCSAAKCSVSALPRQLETAGKALGLPVQKDTAGHTLMMKMCKPRKPKKSEKVKWLIDHDIGDFFGSKPSYSKDQLDWAITQMPTLWHELPEQLIRLFEYCVQDVDSEYCLDQAVRDLSPDELEIFFLDRIINQRGIYVDIPTIRSVLNIIDSEEEKLLQEITEITEGEVTSPRQTAASLKWLLSQGVSLPNMQKTTVDKYLEAEDII